MTKLIDLKNISVIINKKQILSNICLKINSKKIITIFGPNGAGKSTLIRVILKLININKGTIKYYKNLKIGYVPQKLLINPTLPITVNRLMQQTYTDNKENIIFTLKKVEADHLMNCLLENLSSGEIQKIFLARALLRKPNLLVLDEPTRGIDINGKISFYNLINSLREELNCTILLVSHNLNFIIEKTDKLVFLNKHIIYSGIPENIFKEPNFYSLFGSNLQKLKLYNQNLNYNPILKKEKV